MPASSKPATWWWCACRVRGPPAHQGCAGGRACARRHGSRKPEPEPGCAGQRAGGGRRERGRAMGNSRIKHSEYRDDRFVAATDLRDGRLDCSTCWVVTPGSYVSARPVCRRHVPPRCARRGQARGRHHRDRPQGEVTQNRHRCGPPHPRNDGVQMAEAITAFSIFTGIASNKKWLGAFWEWLFRFVY